MTRVPPNQQFPRAGMDGRKPLPRSPERKIGQPASVLRTTLDASHRRRGALVQLLRLFLQFPRPT